MKKNILVIIISFIGLSLFAQQIELTEKINTTNNIKQNKAVFVHPTKISKAIYHDVLPSLKDLPPVTEEYYKEKTEELPMVWNTKLKSPKVPIIQIGNLWEMIRFGKKLLEM